MPTKNAEFTIEDLAKILNRTIVFNKQPYSEEAKSLLIEDLHANNLAESSEYKEFINSLYKNSKTERDKVIACLNVLAKFISDLPQNSDDATVTDLKRDIFKFTNGIHKNAQHLCNQLNEIEHITFTIARSDALPLADRLQILLNLYDPIAQCAPGIQGVIRSTFIYLTSNNTAKRLRSFAQSVLSELNRSKSNQNYDAGPHVLNQDIKYAFNNGLMVLDAENLNDPYGHPHTPVAINSTLMADFTIEKFLMNCQTEIMVNLAGNIQTCLSIREMGLDPKDQDPSSIHLRKVLQGAFNFLGIDVTNPATINQIFISDFVAPNGIYQMLNDLDVFAGELEDITIKQDLSELIDAEWCITTDEKSLSIWYKENGAAREIIKINSTSPEYELILKKFEGSHSTKTTEIYQIINPNNKQGSTNLKINYHFVRYMILCDLLQKYDHVGISDKKIDILSDTSENFTPLEIKLDSDHIMEIIPYNYDIDIFIRDKNRQYVSIQDVPKESLVLARAVLSQVLVQLPHEKRVRLAESMFLNNILGPAKDEESINFQQEHAKSILEYMIIANPQPISTEFMHKLRINLGDNLNSILASIIVSTVSEYSISSNNFKFLISAINKLDNRIEIIRSSIPPELAKAKLAEYLNTEDVTLNAETIGFLCQTFGNADDLSEHILLNISSNDNHIKLQRIALLIQSLKDGDSNMFAELIILLHKRDKQLLKMIITNCIDYSIFADLKTDDDDLAFDIYNACCENIIYKMTHDGKDSNLKDANNSIKRAKILELFSKANHLMNNRDKSIFFEHMSAWKLDKFIEQQVYYTQSNHLLLNFIRFMQQNPDYNKPSINSAMYSAMHSGMYNDKDDKTLLEPRLLSLNLFWILPIITGIIHFFNPILVNSFFSSYITLGVGPGSTAILGYLSLLPMALIAVMFPSMIATGIYRYYKSFTYNRLLSKDNDKSLINAAIDTPENIPKLLFSKQYTIEQTNNMLFILRETNNLKALGLDQCMKDLNDICNDILKANNAVERHHHLDLLDNFLNKTKQLGIFKHNPAVFFEILRNHKIDSFLMRIARTDPNVNNYLLEVKHEQYLQLDPKYKPALFSRYLSMAWQYIDSGPKSIIPSITITVSILCLAAGLFYLPTGLESITLPILGQLNLGGIQFMQNFMLYVPAITAAVSTGAYIGYYSLLALPQAISEFMAARTLFNNKHSKLVDLAIDSDSRHVVQYLQQNTCTNQEVQAAIKIAKFCQRPSSIISSLQKYVSQPKRKLEPISLPTIDESKIVCEKELKEQILQAFRARLTALEVGFEAVTKIADHNQRKELEVDLKEELRRFTADWEKFIRINDENSLNICDEYTSERIQLCEQLSKNNLLILSDYVKAEQQEHKALEKLYQTAQKNKPIQL